MGTWRPGATRRDARERALHLLYEADRRDLPVSTLLESLELPPDPYAVVLARGVADHREAIRARLARLSHGWAIDRMPVMDLLVLEMGVFELEHQPEVPTAVILNEAVELVSRYSTEESGRFVNGVLAAAAEEVRPSPSAGR